MTHFSGNATNQGLASDKSMDAWPHERAQIDANSNPGRWIGCVESQGRTKVNRQRMGLEVG